MAVRSVHHELAAAKLAKLAISPNPATIIADFGAAFPGWDASADLMRGYTGDGHEETIKAAWALQDGLPEPLCFMEFEWQRKHGMTVTMVYLAQGRTPEDLKALFEGAAERVLANA